MSCSRGESVGLESEIIVESRPERGYGGVVKEHGRAIAVIRSAAAPVAGMKAGPSSTSQPMRRRSPRTVSTILNGDAYEFLLPILQGTMLRGTTPSLRNDIPHALRTGRWDDIVRILQDPRSPRSLRDALSSRHDDSGCGLLMIAAGGEFSEVLTRLAAEIRDKVSCPGRR